MSVKIACGQTLVVGSMSKGVGKQSEGSKCFVSGHSVAMFTRLISHDFAHQLCSRCKCTRSCLQSTVKVALNIRPIIKFYPTLIIRPSINMVKFLWPIDNHIFNKTVKNSVSSLLSLHHLLKWFQSLLQICRPDAPQLKFGYNVW